MMSPDSIRDRAYRSSHARAYHAAIADADSVIAEAIRRANGGPIAVGLSGGKDSVAMAHRVAQHCRPTLLHNDSGLELPESLPVCRALAERLGLDLAVVSGDARAEVAAGVVVGTDALLVPVQRYIREHGVALEFVGLRRAEARTRRMLIGRYGPVHDSRRWGCLVAWPMRAWSAADVFAYLDEHQLPIHPAYLREWGPDRDSIRVSWAYDPARQADGDEAYLRHYYPALFRELRQQGVLRP
jgi:3'-phosphoadenosine 5'-phosphosulfate sulfotransferase (PAPS reductase)/FAD synthetase